MPKPKIKTWVRKEKIVTVGNCKYCHKDMTSEDSFIPVGKVINNRYIYKNAHYDCVRKADEDKTYENESKFDW